MTSPIGREVVRGAEALQSTESAGGAAITPDEARALIHDIMGRRGHDAGSVEAAVEELAGMAEADRGGLTDGDIANLRSAAHAEGVERHGSLGRADGASGARAAAGVYARHASDSYSLTNPADVGSLISRTPQLDNLSDAFTGTGMDAHRCGGAAVFNALLLSGHPAAAASALRDVGHANGMDASNFPGVPEALSAMERGEMTGAQAALLQEYAYNIARRFNLENADTRPGVGTSRDELQPFLEALAGHSPNPFEGATVELSNHTIMNPHHPRPADEPASLSHWTCSVTSPAMGHHSADSWPRTDGYATITDGALGVPGRVTSRAGVPDPT